MLRVLTRTLAYHWQKLSRDDECKMEFNWIRLRGNSWFLNVFVVVHFEKLEGKQLPSEQNT